jgi:inner membrane protein involved in colicin E2 resistance
MFPLWRVESLIAERSALRDNVVERVANGAAHPQNIGAIMMILPVTRSWVDSGKDFWETKRLRVLADSVNITGSVSTKLNEASPPQRLAFSADKYAVTRLVSGAQATTIGDCGPRRCRS